MTLPGFRHVEVICICKCSCLSCDRTNWAAISAGLLQVWPRPLRRRKPCVPYPGGLVQGRQRAGLCRLFGDKCYRCEPHLEPRRKAQRRCGRSPYFSMQCIVSCPCKRKLQLRVSYTTATASAASASRNGTEVEDANASNDTAVDSDEDDSDTIIYNTLTDVGPLPRCQVLHESKSLQPGTVQS